MPSRFDFLEDQFPKLFAYGRKAEECISTDPNICLLNLGRIAEHITDNLCRRNNIPNDSEKVDTLLSRGLITDEIAGKITVLTEIKHEAANDEYDSEMACSRLLLTAEELCMWFVNEGEGGRFAFLADLYPPDKPAPVLMNLSVLGREAEENLCSNTRYCLICLGDIGEAVVVTLITGNGIDIHERDQIDRIDALAEKSIIPDNIKKILHDLRMARNKALHERYNDEYTSEAEGKRLLDDALTLCEWMFTLTMKAGYIVKARITGEDDGGYSAVIGRIRAFIPAGEIPEGQSCVAGKKYVLKISDAESEPVTLSLSNAERDYNISVGRLYAKYKPGQKVHVKIKTVSKTEGAVAELKDGLEARIPPSELGRKFYVYAKRKNKKKSNEQDNPRMLRYDVTARVKWFSLTQYPPMILSVRDVEYEKPVKPAESSEDVKTVMSDIDFYRLCRLAPYEKIIQALDEGANPNSSNNNGTTALMIAAEHNKNARVLKALIEAGADVNARNRRGNTALMFAAMRNTPEAVRILYEAGADIDAANSEGKNAANYAVSNRRLNGTEILKRIKGEPEPSEVILPPQEIDTSEVEPQAEAEPTEEFSEPQQETSVTEPEPSEAVLPPQEIDTQEVMPQAETELTEEFSEPQQETINPQNESPIESQQDNNRKTETISQQESIDDEPEYYEYEMQDMDDVLTPEEEETLCAVREELQRDFLKICRSGTEDEIAEAVSTGVDVNVTNKAGATALMFAAKSNTAGAVEILIHAGASLNVQDKSGNTALIYAASYNNDDVIETLIEAGAEKDITNYKGYMASDYARRNYRLNDTEVARKLGG